MELDPLTAPTIVGSRNARAEALHERHLGVQQSER